MTTQRGYQHQHQGFRPPRPAPHLEEHVALILLQDLGHVLQETLQRRHHRREGGVTGGAARLDPAARVDRAMDARGAMSNSACDSAPDEFLRGHDQAVH